MGKNDFFYEYGRDTKMFPSCWKSENDCCGRHFHSSVEIVYVKSGELKADLNGTVYEVCKGQILIVPSYTVHHYVTEHKSLIYVCVIPLEHIPSFKPLLARKTFAASLLPESPENKEIYNCLEGMRGLSEENPTMAEQMILKGYSYVVMGKLVELSDLAEIKNVKMNSRIQEILVYLQEHYLETCCLEDIATYFGYSKSRFSHIFNQYFGCRLVEYINGLRCSHALELIKEKKLSILEIAYESGFESTRTFYRAFQNYYGFTPRKYVLNLQESS